MCRSCPGLRHGVFRVTVGVRQGLGAQGIVLAAEVFEPQLLAQLKLCLGGRCQWVSALIRRQGESSCAVRLGMALLRRLPACLIIS